MHRLQVHLRGDNSDSAIQNLHTHTIHYGGTPQTTCYMFMYKINVGTRYFAVGRRVRRSHGTVGNAPARRAVATAGCAFSLRSLGQAEPKRVDHVDGNQSCSKLGQNGEYRTAGDTYDSVHPSEWCCAGLCARALALLVVPASRAIHRV